MSSIHTSTSTPRASRISPLRTRRARAGLAGVAVLVALPVLAACSAGNSPEVYNIKPDNGQGQAGYMYISNVWVVQDQSTGNAEVIGQVANTDPTTTNSNQLTSVTVGGAAATIVPPTDTALLGYGVQVNSSTVTIPGLKSVQFGQVGQPELEVSNADVTIGANTNVVYTFSGGEKVTVAAIVEPNTGLWANYNPNGLNSTPSASASAGATGTATASGTASGTAKATGTASSSASSSVGASSTASGSASPSATR